VLHRRLVVPLGRRFKGLDALKLFSDISVNSFAKFDIDRSKHVIHANKNGKVIHEGILSRLDTEEFLLFGRGCFWVGNVYDTFRHVCAWDGRPNV
jgi:vanillate/3-O-methylgallate O-demethylase